MSESEEEDGIWTAEVELWMLDAMEAFPPFGANRETNVEQIAEHIRKRTGKEIDVDLLYEHLEEFYSLDELPESEGGSEDSEDKTKKKKDTVKKTKRRSSSTSTGGESSGEAEEKETDRLVTKRDKLEDIYDQVRKKKQKYTSLSQFIYAALKDQGGAADLLSIYAYIEKNWNLLDKKYAEKFGADKRSDCKSNIRSTLYTNKIFEKGEDSRWSLSSGLKKEDDAPKKKRRKKR
eukprot:TRINITY_DN6999_c0_g1_i1.p1 TRINITY_DN6999_c0_g1~~TRINITY_DN6999_c0_g1_i1.p1  ORF type:complete len:247 (+),score=66.34 TRINITY_DN6999_c0_g1_i1:40-741(+)